MGLHAGRWGQGSHRDSSVVLNSNEGFQRSHPYHLLLGHPIQLSFEIFLYLLPSVALSSLLRISIMNNYIKYSFIFRRLSLRSRLIGLVALQI